MKINLIQYIFDCFDEFGHSLCNCFCVRTETRDSTRNVEAWIEVARANSDSAVSSNIPDAEVNEYDVDRVETDENNTSKTIPEQCAEVSENNLDISSDVSSSGFQFMKRVHIHTLEIAENDNDKEYNLESNRRELIKRAATIEISEGDVYGSKEFSSEIMKKGETSETVEITEDDVETSKSDILRRVHTPSSETNNSVVENSSECDASECMEDAPAQNDFCMINVKCKSCGRNVKFYTSAQLLLALMEIVAQKLEEECKIADICRHDQVPMCGIDSCGELRTFIDTCDMHEFNCDSRKDFVQKPIHECWVTCKRGRSFKRPTYGEGCDGINKV